MVTHLPRRHPARAVCRRVPVGPRAMTLTELRRRCANRELLVRVANSNVSVRICAREARRLLKCTKGRVEVDTSHGSFAFIRVPRRAP